MKSPTPSLPALNRDFRSGAHIAAILARLESDWHPTEAEQAEAEHALCGPLLPRQQSLRWGQQ